MQKIMTFSALAMLATGLAQAAPHSDARQAHASTVKTTKVKYVCQDNKKLTVKYGFNKQNRPTYAEAKLNGKTRFMPINLHETDESGTTFGDENNFSLYGDPMTFSNHRRANINIQSPSNEILYKLCKAKKR
ncbi:ACP-like domain-containing protein [Bibersteinia trehalosi]|uniref:ACP-like domain-containing protein n=1 Tax=Bibersteinia trehalosi TaxID=47735 RepID=UPI0040453222